MNIEAALKEAMSIDGALGACLVDWESGMSLGAIGGGKYLTSTWPRPGTRRSSARRCGRWSPSASTTPSRTSSSRSPSSTTSSGCSRTRNEQGLLVYLVLERSKANLARARHSLKRIESDLTV